LDEYRRIDLVVIDLCPRLFILYKHFVAQGEPDSGQQCSKENQMVGFSSTYTLHST